MKILIAAALAACCAGPAMAHVSLETPRAAAGSSYQAVLRITHGCQGAATHTVSVQIPAGLRGAKPMPKPGWALSTRREPLAQAYESHGRRITDEVVEVTWRASSREAWLADAHFDEFVLRGQLPALPGALWFKVRQLCEQGEWHWNEVPTEGRSTKGLMAPAVLLEVLPAETPGHAH